jgi:GT2 family glycosyltransferase
VGGLERTEKLKTSVVIVAYHAGPALSRCLASLREDRDEFEIIVVDNGDGDQVSDAREDDSVTVISPGRNLGFAAGCNLGARHAAGEALVFLNPDTVVAPGAVRELELAVQDSMVGIAMARLRLLEEPDLLNSDGNVVHLTGLSWAGGYREPAVGLSEVREVAFPSGAAMAVRAETFRKLGEFTDELFMYLEDLELGWRARLQGLRVIVTPKADVFHEYEFGRHQAKQSLIERNRLVFVFSSYSWRMLLLLAPLLGAAEVGMLGLAAREGWLKGKLAGWAWCVRHIGWLARHRRETQRLRRLPDRELAQFLTPLLDPKVMEVPRIVPLANGLMRRYWWLAQKAL